LVDKPVKISEELYNLLQDEASKRNSSIKDVLESIIRSYYAKTDQGIKQSDTDNSEYPQLKIIVALYDGKCKECGKEIRKGNLVAWGKGYGTICLDCYYKKIPDTGLVKKYIKAKELEIVHKRLKKLVDELSDKYIMLRKSVEFFQVLNDVKKVVSDIYKVFSNPSEYKDLIERLDELIDRLERMNKMVEFIATQRLRSNVRVRKSEKEVEVSK